MSTSHEIWFLTGSQSLYGEETLAQVAHQSQAVMAQLGETYRGPATLVWKDVVTTPDGIRQMILEANSTAVCVGVITWMHTFSPAKMWIAGLDALQKPLLHLHTQANQALPWATIDMDFMNLNQAAHGDREYAHILSRMDIARKIVVGYPGDSVVAQRVTEWAFACAGWDAARNLKLARFGDNMRYVAVTDGDKVSAQTKFGFSVESLGVNTLASAVAEVSDADAAALCTVYDETYAVGKDLGPGGDRRESLEYGAKIEIALRHILEAGGFRAFTSNFEDLGSLRQLPGLAVQRLMADGYGFAGEGDWKTSAMVAIVKAMGPAGGATSFMEDYTYHFGPGAPKVLGAHMLEVCPTLTTSTPRIEIHPLGIGGKEDPVRMVFTADAAPGRVLCLTDLGHRFRIVVNEVTVVEPTEDLPQLPVARAVWEPQPSLAESAASWMLAGGSHHTVLTTAVSSDTVVDFARIAKTELVSINESTQSDRFAQELRWNEAYYRVTSS